MGAIEWSVSLFQLFIAMIIIAGIGSMVIYFSSKLYDSCKGNEDKF